MGGVPDVKPKDEKQALTDNIIGTDCIITLGNASIPINCRYLNNGSLSLRWQGN